MSSACRCEPGAEPLRSPGSGLPPLPLDPGARFELAPSLEAQLRDLARELGADAARSGPGPV